MNLEQLNQKRKALTRNVLLLGAIAALVIAPLTYWIFKGLLGIAALGVAGLLGLAIVNSAPVFAMKFANWRLKSIKAEASRNPIETLQNELNKQIQQKDLVRARIIEFNTQVKSFEDKVEGFKTSFPADAPKFEAQLEAMKKVLSRREAKYKELVDGLKLFETEIERANAIWQMSQAAQALNAAAGVDIDFMSKIKTETAIESVQLSLNRAFSEMETELLDEEPKQLERKAPIVLELEPVTNKVTV